MTIKRPANTLKEGEQVIIGNDLALITKIINRSPTTMRPDGITKLYLWFGPEMGDEVMTFVSTELIEVEY